MTKYREILRLLSLELSQRDIATSLGVSRNTVTKVRDRAKELSLSWPLDKSFTDAELEQRMFPKDSSPKFTKRMPDFDYIRKELLKNAVLPCTSRGKQDSRLRLTGLVIQQRSLIRIPVRSLTHGSLLVS